jgi:hypothetical protein
MKILILVVFILASTTFSAQTVIPKDYSLSLEKPILILENKAFISACDTLYLINNKRYLFYKKMHQVALSDKNQAIYNDLINQYLKTIEENEKDYQLLLNNCKKSDEVNMQFQTNLTNNIKNLSVLIESNKTTILASEQTIKNLEQTIKDNKKQNRKQKLLLIISSGTLGALISTIL